MAHADTLPPIEARYGVDRWHMNNGGRVRRLALGRRTAAEIAAIRAEGLPAALRAIEHLGGVTQPVGLARSLVAVCRRLPEAPAARRIIDHQASDCLQRVVLVPDISWRWHGHRQVATVGECAIIAVRLTGARPSRETAGAAS